MDGNFKVEKWTLEDGRRAEKRVTEVSDSNGQGERIIELHVEDERPLRLQQRVIEKTKPVIYERKIETVDKASGQVIDQKVEALEPKPAMQVVEHISVDRNAVSKEEIVSAVLEALKSEGHHKCHKHAHKVQEVQSLGLAEEFAKLQQPQSDGMSVMDKVLLVVIAAQVIGLAYILFFM